MLREPSCPDSISLFVLRVRSVWCKASQKENIVIISNDLNSSKFAPKDQISATQCLETVAEGFQYRGAGVPYRGFWVPVFDVHTALPLFWFPVLHDSSSHRFNDGFYSVYFICQKLSNDNHNVPDYGTHTNRRSSRPAVIEYPIGRSLHKVHTTHYVYQYWQFFGRRLAHAKEK